MNLHSDWTRHLARALYRSLFLQAFEDSLTARLRRGKPFLGRIVSPVAFVGIWHGLVKGLAGDIEVETLRANVDYSAVISRHRAGIGHDVG